MFRQSLHHMSSNESILSPRESLIYLVNKSNTCPQLARFSINYHWCSSWLNGDCFHLCPLACGSWGRFRATWSHSTSWVAQNPYCLTGDSAIPCEKEVLTLFSARYSSSSLLTSYPLRPLESVKTTAAFRLWGTMSQATRGSSSSRLIPSDGKTLPPIRELFHGMLQS